MVARELQGYHRTAPPHPLLGLDSARTGLMRWGEGGLMYYLVLQVTDDALQAGTHGRGFGLDIAREIDHNANASFLSFLPSFS